MDSVRIAAYQPVTDLQQRASNVGRALAAVADAAAQGADLVCLPETYPGPWTPPLDYDALPALRAAARANGIFVAAGFIEPAAGGGYYVSHGLIDDQGDLLGTYRRTTPSGPWLYKGHFFWDFDWQAADQWPVYDTRLGVIGMAICSEVYMPEVSRALALQGAEIILLPSGTPKGPMWETWRTLLYARAIENLAITVSCQNLFTPDDRGLALICGPEKVLAESTQPGLLLVDCDLARLRLLRAAEDSWDFPGPKKCKPGIFWQWYRPDLHGAQLARIGQAAAAQPAPGE